MFQNWENRGSSKPHFFKSIIKHGWQQHFWSTSCPKTSATKKWGQSEAKRLLRCDLATWGAIPLSGHHECMASIWLCIYIHVCIYFYRHWLQTISNHSIWIWIICVAIGQLYMGICTYLYLGIVENRFPHISIYRYMDIHVQKHETPSVWVLVLEYCVSLFHLPVLLLYNREVQETPHFLASWKIPFVYCAQTSLFFLNILQNSSRAFFCEVRVLLEKYARLLFRRIEFELWSGIKHLRAITLLITQYTGLRYRDRYLVRSTWYQGYISAPWCNFTCRYPG